MKTKTIFKSFLVVLFLGASMGASAYVKDPTCASAYVKDPTLCKPVTAKWDAIARTFTLSNLPAGLKNEDPFCAWVTDPSWAEGTYDWTITKYDGSFTPGMTTYTTGRLSSKWGDPLKGGTNGSSYLYIALKGAGNDIPKCNPKSADCSKTFKPVLCCGPEPIFCKNFNATFKGSIIILTGTLNYSNDNMYLIANSDFTKWQILPHEYNGYLSDTATASVEDLVYYNTSEKVYPYAKGVMVYMNSDDKGGGDSGHGPNYCSKAFSPTQTNISDIITHSISITPNTATSSETITIKGEYAADAKVSITSVSGAMVGSVIPSVGADAMTVSLSGLNLQAGIYFLRIDSGEKVYVGKLCVK